MRTKDGRYQRAGAPVGGSYQYGDLVCLGRDAAVVLVRFMGWAYFLTCKPIDLIVAYDEEDS